MSGYFVAQVTVDDPDMYARYRAASGESIAAHGGVVLAADDHPAVLEGTWAGPRTVIVRFDSVADARRWYASPAYQEVVGLRHRSTSGGAALVDGLG